jgi:TolB-like protein/Flp pilus assembly protein TadD
VIGGVLLLALGATLATQWHGRNASAESSANGAAVVSQPPRSIAVLPFVNLSGGPENEHFSDGLSEELLNRLTMIPELHVVARTSSFYFKGKTENVRKIGQMLGVRHVLEGSVRREGDQLRVTAQLVSTEDGYRLWSHSFDRHLADVFALQDEIARTVAEKLELTLAADPDATSSHRMTRNPAALELYLRGKQEYQSWELERIDKGIEYFEAARRIDPDFAAVYVSQAEALFARAQVTGECCNLMAPWSGPRQILLHRAVELDPRNADAIASLGLDLMLARDFAGAERELHRAEAINPNGELVLRYLNMYYHGVGWPPDRAIDYARRQFKLDPLNPLAAVNLTFAYWQTHHYEEAVAAGKAAIALDPNSWRGYWALDAALIDLGRYEEAIVSARKATALSGNNPDAAGDLVVAYAGAGRMDDARKLLRQIDDPSNKAHLRPAFRAYVLAGLGDYEGATASLEQAYRENDGFLHECLHYKIFMPLHADPRFQKLVHLLHQERRVQHTRDMNQSRSAVAAAK